MRLFYSLVAAALIFPASAWAAPSVFVQSSPNAAFWNSDKTIGRILEKQAGPVTAKALTAFIAEERQFGPYEICALSAASRESYVGVDKQTATELQTYDSKSWTTYRTTASTPDGRQVVGQAVLFESCDGELKGAGVLTYDAKTGAVLMFQEMTSSEKPYWFTFLHPNTDKTDSQLFSYSGCLECGSNTAVYYDVTRKRVYIEYNGH